MLGIVFLFWNSIVLIVIIFGFGNFDFFYSFEFNKVIFLKYLYRGIEFLNNIDGILC